MSTPEVEPGLSRPQCDVLSAKVARQERSPAKVRGQEKSSLAFTVRHAPLLLVLRFFRLAWGALACRGLRLSAAGLGCQRRAPAVCRGLLSPVVGLLLLLLLLLLSGGRPAKSWKQMCQ